MTSIRRFLVDPFYFSVILILGFAFNTKLISLLANGRYLHHSNALLGITEGNLLVLSCTFEAGVMTAIYFLSRAVTRSWITLWLCASFLAYRLGMSVYPHSSCSCFGRLADWIAVDDSTLDRIQLASLLYMAAGAIAVLLCECNSPPLPGLSRIELAEN